ncbi:MmoB/DmpM family protein [Methylibium sp. T29]|uniref:MmoB/DmpM family protein n=1 Tax=Methylibium sp. T29 TaxID=1430884 RepID=UPI0003F45E7D|nr:MmoB/DmpM family protein [Methylibium sp. T29]EWS54679.1 Phenol hydroxylase P2 protein [Methylibium sp. T29]
MNATATAAPTARPPVFISLVSNDISRGIVEAIVADNPEATVTEYPAMVKIDSPGRLVIRRESVEEQLGRHWDVQELHLNLISLSGNIDETDDAFTLQWGARA